eukprot:gb/GEZN01016024.1/.p1 GENE.gb/GEZN01016024.1/~~gb/GEZN01016024.1/.p1  ORF type:complete len:114 (+),score=1.42 gb/GEZN01016024.1/:43-384(+)
MVFALVMLRRAVVPFTSSSLRNGLHRYFTPLPQSRWQIRRVNSKSLTYHNSDGSVTDFARSAHSGTFRDPTEMPTQYPRLLIKPSWYENDFSKLSKRQQLDVVRYNYYLYDDI